uniref:Uncharacterized protein n=1 Tax=viral metagenome TaxID=1070528 RepID=A0A6M3JJE2_9ZZZZ
MIKRILLYVLTLLMFLIPLNNINAIDNSVKIEKFIETFKTYKDDFLDRAIIESNGIVSMRYIEKTVGNIRYYMNVDFNYDVIIFYVMKQVEMKNNSCDVMMEGITIRNNVYTYFINRYIVHRESNDVDYDIQPLEIWDECVDMIFKK